LEAPETLKNSTNKSKRVNLKGVKHENALFRPKIKSFYFWAKNTIFYKII